MSRDSISHTFKLAGSVCIACSVVVAGAAVGWRAKQEKNKREEMQRNVLKAAYIYEEDKSIEEQFANIETHIVNLETGEFASTENGDPALDADTYKPRRAAKDNDLGMPIAAADDFGGIKRRERYAIVYLVIEDGKVVQVVLPNYGKGLWSTLYGFVSLDADLNTIKGLTYYDQKETPGLGGEVDSEEWKKQWPNKQAFDENGEVKIEVLRGPVNPTDPAREFKVDGLAGATITSRGVTNMLRYWLGKNGFRPFLDKMKASGRLAERGQTNG